MYFGNYEVQPMSAMRSACSHGGIKRVSAHVYSVTKST